jgi:shikimate kinase
MGTGKTKIGKALASIHSLPFVDVDEEIEKRTRMKIVDIFSRMGEGHFRDLEEEMIREASREEGKIIAVGGGALQRESNLLALRENGFLLCLLSTPKVILRRLRYDDTRPLLKGEDKLQRIESLLRKRFPNYLKADAFLDTSYMSIRDCVKYVGRLLDYLKGEAILPDQKPEDRWVKSAFEEKEEELKSLVQDNNASVSLTATVRLWKNNSPLDWKMLQRKRNIFFKWLMEEVAGIERNNIR